MAARKDSGPLSLRLLTVKVLGTVRSSSTVSRGTKERRGAADRGRWARLARVRSARCPDRERHRADRVGNHIVGLLSRAGLRYHEMAIAAGAQTERPGGAGPVRALLGG